MELAPCNFPICIVNARSSLKFLTASSCVAQNHCTMVELRGFEPARHVLARTTPAIHFNTSNLSKSTRFGKTTVLWWSYGDSNPPGMSSQEQRRRSTSIITVYQRVHGSAKPQHYSGGTSVRYRTACPRTSNAGDPLLYS